MRGLLSEDLKSIRWVRDPAMSPNGERVAYVLKEVADEDTYHDRLMVIEPEGNQYSSIGKELLPGFSATIQSLEWLPCGERLAFISNHSGKKQLWIYDFLCGGLGRITDAPFGISEFRISPDGKQAAFSAPIEDRTGEHGEYAEGYYRVTKRLVYKTDGAGYWKCRWSQVWLCQLPEHPNSAVPETTAPLQLTDGPYNHGSLDFSPDGGSLVCITSRDPNPDQTPFRDVFLIRLDLEVDCHGSHHIEPLTSDMVAASPCFSPNGEYVAFIGHDNSDDRATNTGLWITDGQRLVNLTADIDRPIGDVVSDDMNAEVASPRPIWTSSGREIMTLVSDSGNVYPMLLEFPGDSAFDADFQRSYASSKNPDDPFRGSQFNARILAAGTRRVFAISYAGGDDFVVAESTPENPGDIVKLTSDENGCIIREKRLTQVNKDLFSQLDLAKPEPISFTGSLGRTIRGWLLVPPNRSGPHPLVLHVHGGPHAAYSPAFNFELQHLASEGFAVLFVNPHGSHSYGRAINTGTQHDWGGKDYQDLMMSVDSVMNREDIDNTRIGVAGGSYGGWMTNYIITQTNRFKAAVAQRSSSNRISTFTGSAMGYRHARWESPGTPWSNPEYFTRISPVLHADLVNTPLLLIHAEHDHLCPLTQAEEMYTALKMQDKTVELLTFLGESHHMGRVGKPRNRITRLDRTAEWFHMHL